MHALKVTGLRFFTVYGPWGRPDMAPTLFARAISEGQPVRLFNEGKNLRDFTYIDDIAEGVVRALLYPFERAEGSPTPPARVFNLGHHRPVETLLFVRMLERLLGRTAKLELLPPQPGDMVETCADSRKALLASSTGSRVIIRNVVRRADIGLCTRPTKRRRVSHDAQKPMALYSTLDRG
jgi:UDP-glucuronate 4-epimerase